jgi:ABC-2 type transport system permease protein
MSTTSALWRKTRYQWHNATRAAFQQSRLKQIFTIAFMLLFETFLLLLFRDGFRFLSAFGGAGVIITSRIFSLFFLGLMWMLMLSGLVSSYAGFFSSPEIPFLLVRPFTMQNIVVYKFIQSAAISSWAFFFIVLPFVGAYVWHHALNPVFIVWTCVFSIPFLFLSASLGAVVVLMSVRWLPRPGKWSILSIVLIVSIVVVGLSLMGNQDTPDNNLQFNIASMVPGMRMATHPMSPGYWMSEGIMSLTRGQYARGALFLALLISSAMVATMIVEQTGKRMFYPAWQRARATTTSRRKPVLLPMLKHGKRLFAPDMAAMMTKDIRIFLRDPAQWIQALVFFGLLGLYFSNLRLFDYNQLPVQWRSAMTFLNVFAVSAVLSSLGSRFIYPQLSFEGHSFWMLGLSPATMSRVIKAKFILSIIASGSVSISLIFISAQMLNLEPVVQYAALAVIIAVSFAVCGLSTGLGAIFINLDEHNPAAIVSSFGGTLNIVLCLCFMISTITPFAIIFHLHQMGILSDTSLLRYLSIAYLWLVSITMIATYIPLRLGNASLQKRDY